MIKAEESKRFYNPDGSLNARTIRKAAGGSRKKSKKGSRKLAVSQLRSHLNNLRRAA